jgi:tetratricopeptide (TPR) repeat protein
MVETKDLNTVTMARIYEKQGLYDNAAEIYNTLLKKNPERQDISDAIAELEIKRSANGTRLKKSLVSLFVRWFDLALCYNRIVLLRNLDKERN